MTINGVDYTIVLVHQLQHVLIYQHVTQFHGQQVHGLKHHGGIVKHLGHGFFGECVSGQKLQSAADIG